jgi:hypothetical protein
VWAEGEEVRALGDGGEFGAAEEFDGDEALPGGEIEFHGLDEAGEVGDDEDGMVFVATDEGDDFAIFGVKELDGAEAEGDPAFAECDEAFHPPEERVRVALLDVDVDGFVVVFGIEVDGEIERLGIGAGEAGVTVGAPLHGGADAVAIAEVDIFAHADFVAVIDDGAAWEGEEESVEEFDAAPVIAEERCEAATDAEVKAGEVGLGVDAVHVIAFFVGDHFEGEFVVVSEEEGPLGVIGERGSLLEDIDDGDAIFHAERHEEAWHEREVEGHMAFVAVAEVGDGVFGPLVGFGEEHAVFEFGVDVTSDGFEEGVGFGEVFAGGAFAFEEVGDGIEAEAIDAEVKPEVEGLEHGAVDGWMIVIEVGLVRVEAVPEVGVGDGVPGPVGGFGIFEDDAGALVFVGGIAPDVIIAPAGAGFGAAGALEPWVLVGGMVKDEFGDDAEAAAMGFAEEEFEVGECAVARVDVAVMGDVVAVVFEWGGVEREEPEGGDAEVAEIIEFSGEAFEVAATAGVAVVEGADVEFVDDGVAVPGGVGIESGVGLGGVGHAVVI